MYFVNSDAGMEEDSVLEDEWNASLEPAGARVMAESITRKMGCEPPGAFCADRVRGEADDER